MEVATYILICFFCLSIFVYFILFAISFFIIVKDYRGIDRKRII